MGIKNEHKDVGGAQTYLCTVITLLGEGEEKNTRHESTPASLWRELSQWQTSSDFNESEICHAYQVCHFHQFFQLPCLFNIYGKDKESVKGLIYIKRLILFQLNYILLNNIITHYFTDIHTCNNGELAFKDISTCQKQQPMAVPMNAIIRGFHLLLPCRLTVFSRLLTTVYKPHYSILCNLIKQTCVLTASMY